MLILLMCTVWSFMIVECWGRPEGSPAIYSAPLQNRSQRKVMCPMKIIRHHSQLLVQVICSALFLSVTAKQVAWACVAKRRSWLVEEMYIVWSRGFQIKRIKRAKRIWKVVVEKDCQARKLNKEDVMDRSSWRKLIKDVWWSGWVWEGECFSWYWPTWVVPDNGPLNCGKFSELTVRNARNGQHVWL